MPFGIDEPWELREVAACDGILGTIESRIVEATRIVLHMQL